MPSDVSRYLPALIGPVVIRVGGVDQSPADAINFADCTATFDDSGDVSELTITPPAGGGGGDVDLTSDVTGVLPVANGGTALAALGTDVGTFLAASLATGFVTFAVTPSGANLASLLTTALPASKGGTGLTSLGTNVATFLGTALASGYTTFAGTPSGSNLASLLTSALPDTKGGTGLTSLGTNVATFLGSVLASGYVTFAVTPSGANLASLLTSALPDTKGGTGLTALGTGVATFLGTPSGANLASALTTALPDTKGGTGLTALGSGVATFLGTPSGANLASALTTALPVTKGGTGATASTGSGSVVLDTGPTISAPTLSSTPTLSGASTSTSNDAKGTAVDVNPVHVQTTDATVTTLDSFTIASNSAVVVSWLVTAIKSDSSQAAAYSCTACFKNNAGTVAQVGTTTTTAIGESDSAWDATVDNSTTTIRLRITGKSATTIQWTSILTRLTVIP